MRATVGVEAKCELVYSLEPFLDALAKISVAVHHVVRTNAEIYIDDLQWDVEADTEEEAMRAFVQMAEALRDTVQVDMCAGLAYDKAAIVEVAPSAMRSGRFARAVRRRLADACGAEAVAVHILGIDFAAGRP